VTLVAQTKCGKPHGNCFAACVATILDKRIENVDVDVASCSKGSELSELIEKIEEKAKCKIYGFPYAAIVDRAVISTERHCIVEVCTSKLNDEPMWHAVVSEIAEDGKLTMVFNPERHDMRKHLQDFGGLRNLYIVKPLL
jgi:hypothetical protein